MKGFFTKAENVLFPPKCIFCRKIVDNDQMSVCPDCTKKILYNTRKCSVCGKPLDTVYGDLKCPRCANTYRPFVRAFVPLLYKDGVRDAILKFKFSGKRAYYKTLATFIFLEIKKSGYVPDYVTYVPIHFARKGKRGYNQSELLAREAANLLGVKCVDALKRVKNTKPLASLKPKEREEMLRDAFVFRKRAGIKPYSKILLVDDIITTGATMRGCAKILKNDFKCEVTIAAVASAI